MKKSHIELSIYYGFTVDLENGAPVEPKKALDSTFEDTEGAIWPYSSVSCIALHTGTNFAKLTKLLPKTHDMLRSMSKILFHSSTSRKKEFRCWALDLVTKDLHRSICDGLKMADNYTLLAIALEGMELDKAHDALL